MQDIFRFLFLGFIICSIIYLIYLYFEWSLIGWATLMTEQYSNAKLNKLEDIKDTFSYYSAEMYNFEPFNNNLLKDQKIFIGLPPKYIIDAYLPLKIKWIYSLIKLQTKFIP